jgi:hypothetical protein
MMSRKKLPQETADTVAWKSNMQCCLCGEPGKQIHHINGDNTNKNEDNLILLCLEHHDEAEKPAGGVSRKVLTPGVLKEARKLHYERVNKMRNTQTQINNSNHVFAKQMYDALFVREMHNRLPYVKRDGDWGNVDDFVTWLSSQQMHKLGVFAKEEILDELYTLSIETRSGLPESIAYEMKNLIKQVVPIWQMMLNQRSPTACSESVLKYTIPIATQFAYDGALYRKSYRILSYGSELLCGLLRIALLNDMQEVIHEIEEGYRTAFDGARRSGLDLVYSYIEYEKGWAEDIGNPILSHPIELQIIANDKWPSGS